MLKILLIDAIDFEATNKPNESAYEPLGLLYLASHLRSQLDSVEIRIIDRNVQEEIDRFNPDIAGFAFVTINYNIARKYAGIAKSRGIKVVGGGPHLSAVPRTLPREMDIGVVGEGERTFLELIRRFPSSHWEDPGDLKRIPGIVFRDPEGCLIETGEREPVESLDSQCFPARDLFSGRQMGIVTSRGCPYRCSFCFNAHLHRKVRYRTPESVLREIKELVSVFGLKHVAIHDDLFVTPAKRFDAIVESVVREGIPRRVSFSCNVRPNLVTEHLARQLSRMNVNAVFMGIESGVQRTLSYLKPQNATVEQNSIAIKLLNKFGIHTHAGIIIGSPDETEEEIEATLSWLKEADLDMFEVLLLTPLPGTPIWEDALDRGLVSYHMNWSRLDLRMNELNGEDPIIVSRVLSKGKIMELFDKFLVEKGNLYKKYERRGLHKYARNLAKNPERLVYKLADWRSYRNAWNIIKRSRWK